jgi:hypothetical protein
MRTETTEPTQEVLWQMFEGMRHRASKLRRNNQAACDFFHLREAEQVAVFNERILPLWERMGRPELGELGYLEFERAIFSAEEL